MLFRKYTLVFPYIVPTCYGKLGHVFVNRTSIEKCWKMDKIRYYKIYVPRPMSLIKRTEEMTETNCEKVYFASRVSTCPRVSDTLQPESSPNFGDDANFCSVGPTSLHCKFSVTMRLGLYHVSLWQCAAIASHNAAAIELQRVFKCLLERLCPWAQSSIRPRRCSAAIPQGHLSGVQRGYRISISLRKKG